MNSLALLPRKAVQTIWLGKACGVESQRGWGRAQRAGGERRAPGNMPAQPAAGGKMGSGPRGLKWGRPGAAGDQAPGARTNSAARPGTVAAGASRRAGRDRGRDRAGAREPAQVREGALSRGNGTCGGRRPGTADHTNSATCPGTVAAGASRRAGWDRGEEGGRHRGNGLSRSHVARESERWGAGKQQ